MKFDNLKCKSIIPFECKGKYLELNKFTFAQESSLEISLEKHYCLHSIFQTVIPMVN